MNNIITDKFNHVITKFHHVIFSNLADVEKDVDKEVIYKIARQLYVDAIIDTSWIEQTINKNE